MGSYSKTYAAKQAQARAHLATLMAAAQAGDPAAIAEIDRGAQIANNGHIPGTSRGAVNIYRQALADLGDPTHRGNGLIPIAKTKNALQKVGGVVKKAAPLAALIPGVGPLAAAGLGAAGSLASGDNIGQALVSGVTDFAGAKALTAAKAALAARGAAGAAAAGGAAGAAGSAGASAGGGGLGGLVGGALDYAKSHPDQILGAVGAINAAGQQAKGSNAVDRAAGIATADYNQTAPVRQRAIQMLTAPMPTAPDLSYLNDPNNPFARRRPVAAPVAPVTPGMGVARPLVAGGV